MHATSHLRLVTALPRRLDSAVCAGSIANAARSVRADEQRASQRLDAAAAVRDLQRTARRAAGLSGLVRRTG